jgi:hypothetical protein
MPSVVASPPRIPSVLNPLHRIAASEEEETVACDCDVLTASAADYGLIFGRGLTSTARITNGRNLQLAVNAAIEQGLNLLIPAGDLEFEVEAGHRVDVDSGGTSAYAIGVDIRSTEDIPFRIVGKGAKRTRLWIYPTGNTPGDNGPAFPWHGFYIDVSVKRRYVSFEDLSIDGDLTDRVDRNSWGIHGTKNTIGIQVNGSTTGNHQFEVTVNRCHLGTAGSYWTTCVDGTQVPGTLTIKNSRLFAANNPTGWFPGETKGGRFHARDTEFRSGGFGDGGASNVGNYIHPSCSFLLERCLYYGIQRYAIYSNGSPTTQPEYCIISDCYFDASCGFGIQSNPNIPTHITNCQINVVDRRGITLTGSATISNCSFKCNGAILGGSNFAKSFGAGDIAEISNCSFTATANGHPDSMIDANGGGTWVVDNCQIDLAAYESVYAIQVIGSGTRAQIGNCRVTGTNATAYATSISGLSGGVHAVISACEFTGSIRQIRADTQSGSSLWLVHNRMLATGYVFEASNPDNDSIYGVGNLWNDDSFVLYQTDRHQQIQLRPGRGGNVRSASVVLLSPNYDYYAVTGTATIDYIHVGRTGTLPASNQHYTNLFSGRFCLRFTGECSTTSAGNLVPLTTAARRIGSVSWWQLDAATSKIYEVSRSPGPPRGQGKLERAPGQILAARGEKRRKRRRVEAVCSVITTRTSSFPGHAVNMRL